MRNRISRSSAVGLLALALVACKGQAPPAVAVDGAEPQAAIDPADDTRPVAARVNEAADLIVAGDPADVARAVAILEAVVGQDPSGSARFNLGLAYQAQGNLDRAAATYDAVIADEPELGDAWLYLGLVREAQARWGDAISAYHTGIERDDEHMGLRVALISVLRRQGNLDGASEASKAALRVNANSLEVYNNFALTYLDKGDTTLARFILQKALQSIEGAVNNAYLQTNLGWSHYRDGNKPAATEALLKAVELDPHLVPALVYLSRVYLEDRNYTDMVPLLEAARDVDPANPNVQLNLGIAYRGVGRLDDARKAYEQALLLDPSNPTAHFNMGILLGDYNKDYDGSVAAFERYLAAGGSESDLAQAYIGDVSKEKERAGRRAKAEEARKTREAERAREQKLIEEAAASEEAATAEEAGAPEGSAPPEGASPAEEPAPADDSAPAQDEEVAPDSPPVADGDDLEEEAP